MKPRRPHSCSLLREHQECRLVALLTSQANKEEKEWKSSKYPTEIISYLRRILGKAYKYYSASINLSCPSTSRENSSRRNWFSPSLKEGKDSSLNDSIKLLIFHYCTNFIVGLW